MTLTMSSKLNIYDFGRLLLKTKDLDPVYVLLHEARLEDWQLQRWLLAYWCFYHVGTASWITEGDIGYWQRMEAAAGSKEYPRSAERRYFRGQTAIRSVAWLKARGLEDLFAPLLSGSYTAQQVMDRVRTWYGFGDWIAFKIADMLERLGLTQVSFDLGTILYDSPRAGARMLWDYEEDDEPDDPTFVGEWAIANILKNLGPLPAPPRYERTINAQEAETILCKWKSYMGDHYHIGEDVAACRRGLLRFAGCRLAQRLLQTGKRGGLWQ